MNSVMVSSASSEETEFSGFVQFCEERVGEQFVDPQAFYAFSVERYREFWRLFLEWADPVREGNPEPVCSDDRLEFASFFPNLRLSYAENLLAPRSAEEDVRVALVGRHGDGSREEISRRELRERVRTVAAHLRSLGIGPGDRVVAIAANNPAATIGALAAATLGATFSSAAPDMGATAILSRFEQISPKLLLASLGSDSFSEVAAALPSLEALVVLDDGPLPGGIELPIHRLSELVATAPPTPLPEGWERFPFNHPLFILFTSGTTGAPKCIVHGAGGTLIEHLKEHCLHSDLSPQDTLFFQTSAAWMMWNWQLSALACGAKVVLYDGPLAGPGTLWQIVAEEKVTVFGTSPPYLQLCEDSSYSPRREAPAPSLRSVLSTGSVLRDWQFDWVADEVGPVKLQSISGGTDIIGCFVLGHPQLPLRRGMLQSRSLGLDVEALATETTPSDSGVGELVCRNPFPSRPLGILGDEDGSRFHDAYFAANEGVWTHGDLIEFDSDGQARIHGRSDGVLNIQGVRIGPSEIYQALRRVPEVQDAMAVEQRRGSGARIILLTVLRDGALDRELTLRIRKTIAAQTTALHVPELVVAVDELPVTHSGKRSERAGRDAVEGREATNRRALANPESLQQIKHAVEEAEAARATGGIEALAEDASLQDKVRAIWETALGLEGIGDDEDFFALGGTSLQAVEVFTLIRDRLGVELPLSALIEAPTVAELTAAVEDPGGHFQPLVQMRAGSEGPPLYIVHSIWGDVLGMRQLVTAMASDAPVYGIRARGLNAGEAPQASIEEMAASYVALIRELQPQGPYRLAGHSFGGLLAFEMARLLSEAGEKIAWLGIIDAELDDRAHTPARRWAHRVAVPFHYARAVLREPLTSLKILFRGVIPGLIRRGFSRLHRDAALAESEATWMEGASEAHQRLAKHFLDLAGAYRPRPYRGSMTYFLPTVRRFHLFADPLPVWRRVTAGEIEIERVPGPHVGMVAGESGRVVARLIDSHLKEPPEQD